MIESTSSLRQIPHDARQNASRRKLATNSWLAGVRSSNEAARCGSTGQGSFCTSKRCRLERQLAPSEARMLTMSTCGGALLRFFNA